VSSVRLLRFAAGRRAPSAVGEGDHHGSKVVTMLKCVDAGAQSRCAVIEAIDATVFGVVPLALHGGPLWEPLCYAQVGGLTVATFITLLLVPVLYAIFVRDLKIVRWPDE
jgi:Cu/Ag efflux pump CusA